MAPPSSTASISTTSSDYGDFDPDDFALPQTPQRRPPPLRCQFRKDIHATPVSVPVHVPCDFPTSDDLRSPNPADALTFSDELEAERLVQEEQRIAHDKAGVVIRHREKRFEPLFHSSSPLVASPTPAAKHPKPVPGGSLLNSSQSQLQSPIQSSPPGPKTPRAVQSASHLHYQSPPGSTTPTTRRQRPPIIQISSSSPNMDSSPIRRRSLSPELDSVRPSKRLKVTYEDDDALVDLEATSSSFSQESFGLQTPIQDDQLWEVPRDVMPSSPIPLKPVVPNFNLPKGGLFSKHFGPSKFSKEDESPGMIQDKPPASIASSMLTPPPATVGKPALTAGGLSIAGLTSSASRAMRRLKIVTSDGCELEVNQRPETMFGDGRRTEDMERLAGSSSNSRSSSGVYFGVNIRSMIKEAEAADVIKKSQSCIVSQSKSAIPVGNVSVPHKKTMLWTEKYRAKKFTDLIGDERTHRHALRWIKGWDHIVFPSPGKPKPKPVKKPWEQDIEDTVHKKILLIHGPPGLGKTTLAHVIARQAGYEPREINASDDRSGAVVKNKIKDILTIEGVKSCLGTEKKSHRRPVCLIIDEIDGVTGGGGAGGNEAGFIKALTDLILADQQTASTTGITQKKGRKKEAFRMQRPIIAVCNDLYAPALRALRPLAEIVHMRKPPVNLMIERLKWVFEKEGIAAEDSAVRRLVDLSSMGSGGGSKGDMRGALVSGEWIAAKLKWQSSPAITTGVKKSVKRVLTKRQVEAEVGGGGFHQGDGKSSGGGFVGIKDAVEAVFTVPKESGRRGAPTMDKKTAASRVQDLVEGLGEFGKITMDCYSQYPKQPFNDDVLLSKPTAAYEWLFFSDLLGHHVYNEQAYELSPYLAYPILGFHSLFASSSAAKAHAAADSPDGLDMDGVAFTGPNAEWDAREATQRNTALILSLHSSISAIRLSQTFKTPSIIATELSPYLTRILSPRIKPVLVGGSSFAVASVRNESEKRLVLHAARVMEASGVIFERIRVESGQNSDFALRMEPAVDVLALYESLEKGRGSAESVRYAVRQVLDQEWKRLKAFAEKEAREKRMGDAIAGIAPLKANSSSKGKKKVEVGPRGKVKRDFFGRIIEGQTGPSKGAKKVEKDKVWVTYHEGFSNAVRKDIGLEEILGGL